MALVDVALEVGLNWVRAHTAARSLEEPVERTEPSRA
jgi:hypothetical protein